MNSCSFFSSSFARRASFSALAIAANSLINLVDSLSASVPVPAGIFLPIITFSFKPLRVSTLPLTAASVKTLVVSWKLAADNQESVSTEDFEIPNNVGLNLAGIPP